jgi:hypothetical protein
MSHIQHRHVYFLDIARNRAHRSLNRSRQGASSQAEKLPLSSAAAKIARHGVGLLQEHQMLAWFVPPVVVPALLVIVIAIMALLQWQ